MKKTHKKIFGLFGLVLVVAVTIFAAFLPSPKTQATEEKVVDTISVRVVGSTPAIKISGITPNGVVTSASQEITIDYENIERLLPVIKYTDAEGHQFEKNLLDNVLVDYIVGVSDIKLNLLTGDYSYSYQRYNPVTYETETVEGIDHLDHCGYGKYLITASGEGFDGGSTDDSLDFSFLPVFANIKQDGSKVDIGLDYDADDGTGDGQVASIIINIYNDKGRPVGPSPIKITPPTDKYSFDLSEYGLASGDYTISVQAYDRAGNELYKPFTRVITYDAGDHPVPDTGGVMGNLNIAKTDYIITGLIIFSIVGISGAVFISKHDKKTRNGRKR